MGTLPNKRKVLESIIDEQDDFWIIMKPSRYNPTDPDSLCVFQNPAEYKEARVDIPTVWFTDAQFDKIQSAVCHAMESAEIGYKYT
jgi:hypothetical protein